MKFTELNPEFWGGEKSGELTFECPACRNRIAIKFSREMSGVDSNQCRVWKASGEVLGSLTLEPSIQQHPIARNWKPCDAHFSISNGEVVMS